MQKTILVGVTRCMGVSTRRGRGQSGIKRLGPRAVPHRRGGWESVRNLVQQNDAPDELMAETLEALNNNEV